MDQKTVFYQLLEQHINSVSGKFQDKFCVTQESYDQIKEVLATGKGEKSSLKTSLSLVQMKILMVIVLQMTILMVHQMFLGLMIILMMYWLSLQQVLGGLT